MADPPGLPRHLRAVDFAAARATEVRAPRARRVPVSFGSSLCIFSPAPPLDLLLAANEDLQSHPAKPRT